MDSQETTQRDTQRYERMRQGMFEALSLNNGVTLPNRFVVAPMTLWASNDDGSLSDQERTFLANRAPGAALHIVGATLVHHSGKTFLGQPFALSEADLPSLEERARIVHANNSKAILQIHHGGIQAEAKLTAPDQPMGATGGFNGAREMTEADIHTIIESFVRAARLALQAGFDGVEIHGANNYLLQQFVSPHTNRRTDKWGKDKTLLSVEITRAITEMRDNEGRPDFLVGYRLSPEEPFDEGLTMDHTVALIKRLNETDLQFLHISQWNFHQNARRGQGAEDNLARLQVIRDVTRDDIAIIGVGSLNDKDTLTDAFETGWVDMYGFGRAAMINPDLVNVVKNDPQIALRTHFDPDREDQYGIPDRLWAMSKRDQEWLPSVRK